MRLRNLNFARWFATHRGKPEKERWLRELYPWPVFAQVDVGVEGLLVPQVIVDDGIEYRCTLLKSELQPRGTLRHRIQLESDGLGWHGRAWEDEFDLIGTPEGEFVTLFSRGTEELERIAQAFFKKRWRDLARWGSFKSLATSRYLSACLVSEALVQAYPDLEPYPLSLLHGGCRPMRASGNDLWIGYRFHSEGAFSWARVAATQARQVLALYLVDTKYQIRTDLPANASVVSMTDLDTRCLEGKLTDYIRAVVRNLEVPAEWPTTQELDEVIRGTKAISTVDVAEPDVNEALAAIRRSCSTKGELRYQLAAGVVLNAWIESERRRGFSRKKFYAFKARIAELALWAHACRPPGVSLWREDDLFFFRIDGVDFSFHAIPHHATSAIDVEPRLVWSGQRLKPIAPLVLAWARARLDSRAYPTTR